MKRLLKPPNLTEKSTPQYTRLLKQLEETGIEILASDTIALATLADIQSQLDDVRDVLNVEGMTVATSAGFKPHPLLRIYQGLVPLYITMTKEFGLTPRARKRLLDSSALQKEEAMSRLAKYMRPPPVVTEDDEDQEH